MPKNETNKNDKNVNALAETTSTPQAVYAAPAQSATADSGVSGSNSGSSMTRRLGTGAIIGISAAGVALLAGVFGGGIALGATVASHGPAGMAHEMAEADGSHRGGPMQGGPMQGGPMQGGPMQGGPMQGGLMRGPDGDGPMNGNMSGDYDANGMDVVPGGAGTPGTPGAPVTPPTAPTPVN